MTASTLVWFRQDLRLADNPALAAAAAGGSVIPVFIRDDAAAGEWVPGGASRWWLHHSLAALQRELARRGAPLILRSGPAAAVLDRLVAETGATAVHWNRCYEPAAIARDRAIKAGLEARGIAARSFNGALLFEPWTVETKAGGPYRVFSQFWRTCLAMPEPAQPTPAPAALRGPERPGASETLADWQLLPTAPDWAGGLRAAWTPGEAAARERLDRFTATAVHAYKQERDRPDRAATSRLSPHLHFGEISPRAVWHAVRAAAGTSVGAESFLSELGWREFSHHLLFHFPDLPTRALRPDFDRFAWRADAGAFRAWCRGRTGYPIVDAGMRELWQTGTMHNRVRMIAASFLVKDLLLPWQDGARWFWDTLVDADLANNAAGWQWVAGCGADAAPYFRIFNPVLQGERFDPDGAYVRRYVPELARLPAQHIHRPWTAPAALLRDAGVELGTSYPHPIVDHHQARQHALAAFAELKQAGS
ncbi:MAG: deoxyribodipyrimidine photo-lyase [Alphaproteobacteria bacterium]|nr:deoxyribodipyrimidine photo-lyase [Alphaproteobacteria bacterium]